MRLTAYTDYSLRTLIFLAMNREQLVTIQDIADAHGIAKNHLTKVVHHLGTLGYIDTVRGRNGGLRLGREPADINVGEVVRYTETDFHMASCFDVASAGCMYAAACALKGVLGQATAAFLDVLDAVTLEQMIIKEVRKAKAKGAPLPVLVQFHPMGRGRGRARDKT
ncbi:RrF2 family transcriptional regulator [Massilia sp. TSP1-1-2]|uniref:RrF2 family transcriptional regulator n=1 Tax=Massilia sp. TSP1-1-2 TaxID=2804649 RepID=UPI003CEEF613